MGRLHTVCTRPDREAIDSMLLAHKVDCRNLGQQSIGTIDVCLSITN